MKTRYGLVSNSSSSNFIIKKTDIDIDDFRKYLKNTKNEYKIINDDTKDLVQLDEWLKEENSNFLTNDYYFIQRMSDDTEYFRDHLAVLSYLRDCNVKDSTYESNWYHGDYRYTPEDEQKMLKGLEETEKEIETKRAEGKLVGKSFCLTGKMSKDRPEIESIIFENGGEPWSSVKDGLTYLVQADPNKLSGKTKKATELGVTIISEEELWKMIGK